MSRSKYTLILPVVLLITLAAWWLWPAGDNTRFKGKDYRAGNYQVKIAVDPAKPRTGSNTLWLQLRDTTGAPVTGARIEAVAVMPAMGSMPEMRAPVEITHRGNGLYRGRFELSMAGAWPLTVTIKSAAQGNAALQFDLKTSRPGLRLENATEPNPAATPAVAGSKPETTGNGFTQAGNYRIRVQLTPDPPRAGRNQARIEIQSKTGQPVTGAKVRALVQYHGADGTPGKKITLSVTELGKGLYQAEFTLDKPGNWPLALDVETQSLGHGDLVYDMTTGKKKLALKTSTPDGISHYTCSMHPSVKSKTPGTCPICSMNLVPVTKKESKSGIIRIGAKRRQLIGVTTGKVTYRRFVKTIRAAGRVTYNESKIADIALKFNGWIGTLHADYVGAYVKKGEPLFTLYSPDLISAQEEYLEAIRKRRKRTDPLVAASRRRLLRWNISQAQIDRLVRTGKVLEYIPILSPVTGTVVKKNIVAGTAVKAGQTLLRIVDLSTVWVEGQIYEYELASVKTGMQVEVLLPDAAGPPIPGTITYVYPFLEQGSRTNRIRVELDNKDGKLRPNMYAHVHIKVDRGKRLVVPESAVLYSGLNRVVFVDLGKGRLQPRKIKTGDRNEDFIEVTSGLKAGETVVTSGNFLIGAESKLKSGVDQW